MAGTIFTGNYQDHSTRAGYQFELFGRRCGNGDSSPFRHPVTGFGGRLPRMGGDLIGGTAGEKASGLGWDAEGMRDGGTALGSARFCGECGPPANG